MLLQASNDILPTRPREPQDHFYSDTFQRLLAGWNRQRLEPQFPGADWREKLESDAHMLRLEGEFLERLRGCTGGGM